MFITCYPLPRRAAWGAARFLLQHQTRWLGNPRLYSARSRKEKKDVDLNRPPRDEHGRIDVSQLVPGSKMVLNPPEQLVFDAAEKKMKKIVETCRHEIKDMEFRASGRVTPELLSPVRVELGSDKPARLDEVATIGVRDGTTLIVTIFDESMLKDIERAIYAAKLPHITPQRVDGRTLRIPVPKPTVETRKEAFEKATKLAESHRSRVRKEHKQAQHKNKFAPKSTELKEFEKLEHKYLGEIDAALKQMRKDLNV